jgi:hypothetical protein
MEVRMARIEGMMEALIQDRGITTSLTPRRSLEPSLEREDALNNEGYQADTGLQPPIETFSANLAPVRQQLGFLADSPEPQRSAPSMAVPTPLSNADPTSTIRVGSRVLSFPSPADYQRYLDYFFADAHWLYPCINEVEFRLRSEQMLAARVVHANDICFLGLNYVIFASMDALTDTTPPEISRPPPGWHWFLLSDEVIGKRKLTGRGDLSLIQFLIWSVSISLSQLQLVLMASSLAI